MDRIVYQASDGKIYTIAPDGTDRRQVSGSEGTQADATNVWPGWSPDSGSVVFTALSPVAGRATEYSLRRASSLGGREPVLLHVDALSSNGINPGTPHYALWSPSGERIALITDAGQGIVTLNMDAETGLNARGVYDGAPVYISWSSDSNHMLLHINERLFLWSKDPSGGQSVSQQIGSGSISYLVPKWNPTDRSYLYVDVVDSERYLLLGEVGQPTPRRLRNLDSAVAFQWSPDGSKIALFSGGNGQYFDRLEVIDREGQAIGVPLEGLLRGGWWSPDGSKILVASGDESSDGVVAWSVMDAEAGGTEEVVRTLPSAHFDLMLTFHSQYAASHQLWSPTSDQFVVVGAVVGEQGDSGRQFTESGTEVSRVWVVHPGGESAPQPIGDGLFAAWSPT